MPAIFLIAASCAFAGAATDEEDGTFYLQPKQSLSRSQLTMLEASMRAALSGPEVEGRGRTPLEILQAYCGTPTPERLEVLAALNRDRLAETIVLPACLHWQQERDVALPKNGSPWRLAMRFNAKYEGPELRDAQPGSSVKLTDVTSSSPSLQLADSASITVLSDLMRKLDVVPIGEANPGFFEFKVLGQAVAVPLETTLDPLDVPHCDPGKDNWPFSTREVLDTLERNANPVKDRPAVIFVVDTGLPRSAVGLLPLHENGKDRFGDPLWGRHASVNSGESNSTNPYSPDVTTYPDADHGLAVASVAAGLPLIDAKSTARPRIWLFSYSILQQPALGVIVADAAALANALMGAPSDAGRNEVVPIVNFSWGHARENPTFALQQANTSALIVVAAGNDPDVDLDIDSTSLFPAQYGAAANVITVAAIGQDAELLSFSSHGAERVTLSAPGCALGVLTHTGEMKIAHGTSLAAPLVAFTAAIVHSLGIGNAAEIKQRLLMTADRGSDDLASAVKDAAILNIPNAIAVHQDVVRLEGETIRGVVAAPSFVRLRSGKEVSWKSVARLRVTAGAGGALQGTVRYRLSGAKLEWADQDIDPTDFPTITFIDANGQTRSIDARKPFQIIPSYKPKK